MATETRGATLDSHDVAEVLPALGALEQQTRGEIDIQVATAKRYPRSIRAFVQQAREMATLDEDTAEACFYAIPRDGKTVEGPSARFAEIMASAWGHMRVGTRIVGEDDRFITSAATAWDLQTNVAIGFEARRRITNKGGQKFKDDMVGVTSAAASSIAIRNAILKVIPSAFWRPIYEDCRRVAVGSAETLVNRRAKALEFLQRMGATNDRVFAVLGVKGVEDITLDQLLTLRGLASAIKEGSTTVDEAFPQPDIQAPKQKANGAGEPKGQETTEGHDHSNAEARSREMPSAAAGAVGGAAQPSTPAPSGMSSVADMARGRTVETPSAGDIFGDQSAAPATPVKGKK